MDRGIRRALDKKKKAKVKKFVKEEWRIGKEFINRTLEPQNIGKIASAPRACSCRCCANPRKLYKGNDKLTLQERKEVSKEKIDKKDDDYTI